MAEIVVTFLLDKLSQLLAQQLRLLQGVEDRVRSLHSELKMINVFLKSAEGKGNEDGLVKEVVNQIRDVANEAEDVIDTFILNATKQRDRSKLGKLIHSFEYANVLRGVTNKIESIKIVIKEIYDNKDKYDIKITELSGGDAGAEESSRRRRKFVEEDDVVGFVDDSDALVKQLIEGVPQRNVVSIIGMGGLGKTTLAKKIYNNNQVKYFFDYCGWVYVSQEYKTKELLVEILWGVMSLKVRKYALRAELKDELFQGLKEKCSSNMDKLQKTKWLKDLKGMEELNDEEIKMAVYKDLDHIPKKYSELKEGLSGFVRNLYRRNGDDLTKTQLQDMDDADLKSILFESLQGRRYLILLDDVWKPQLWDEVRAVLPDDLNGSRILITSRITEVATHASTTPPYFLRFLDKEESWQLFSKKVFREGRCPPQLETLGRQIAESCDGLPLSLVVLGGLLANKEKTHRTWSKLIGHVNSYLTHDKTQCLDILALSYNHLPRRLKPCFLYFGVYPEDCEIPVRRLLQLWIVEGFIEQIGSRNMVDIAEDYLEELIDRSLIQVASRRADGGVKTCCIHDLLRDLCITESLNEKFLEVHRGVNRISMSKPRRLSILCNASQSISSSPYDLSSVRSFLCFDQGIDLFNTDQWIWLNKSAKLVRVLYLERVELHAIPNQIRQLIHIKFLRINSKYLKVIPASISNLWNLETLDIKDSPVKCLPKGIWKLQQLRHLYLSEQLSLPDPPRTNGKPLQNLQVISTMVFDEQTASLMVNAKFPNVTKLGLNCTWSSHKDLKNLHQLVHLCHLQKLKIIVNSDLPSNPNSFPLTLTKITLAELDSLHSDWMTILGSLPELRVLKILGRHTGLDDIRTIFELDCITGGFRQLQVLKMAKLAVSKWNMLKSAMSCLQHVVIEECVNLVMLPSELWCLTTLKDVEVLWPSPELKMMLRRIKVKDGCKLLVYPPLDQSVQ